MSFNKEALRRYLKFAVGPEATWQGNFRDLNASIVRMVTLTGGARIDPDTVSEEVERLRRRWSSATRDEDRLLRKHLGPDALERLDLFDRIQLRGVLAVCAECRALSEAGRLLFAASRERKKQPNDADRLRKYLAKFGLSGDQVLATTAA